MDVRNCKVCGTLYKYISGPALCRNCKADLEDKFKVVRTYIRKNKDATITKVSEECEVSIKQIREWIREERLAFAQDSAIGIDCEMCGEIIKSGRFCPKCKDALVHGLDPEARKPKVTENPFLKKEKENKMHYMKKDY